MSNVTKANQRRARLHRMSRTILRQNDLCVVYTDVPTERHGIFSARTMLPVRASEQLVEMICGLPHHWTIYLAAFCRDQLGQQYMKAVEIEPQGQYLSDQLESVLREQYRALLDTCNQQHIEGGGWIASPIGRQLSETEAAQIFESIGVWRTTAAAVGE